MGGAQSSSPSPPLVSRGLMGTLLSEGQDPRDNQDAQASSSWARWGGGLCLIWQYWALREKSRSPTETLGTGLTS